MGRHSGGPIARLARTALAKASRLSPESAAVAIFAAMAIFLVLFMFAPSIVAFALAIAAAIAWCVWLER